MSNPNPKIPSKVFSALNGSEIKDIIMSQIRAQLDGDDRFGQHITFPVVQWEWNLKLKYYPSNVDGGEINLALRESIMPKGDLPPLAEPFEVEHADNHATEVPDATRREFGMPITQPVRNEQGRFVDRPITEKPLPTVPGMESE